MRQAITTGLADYAPADPEQASPGDLARAILLHLAATKPVLIFVITQATGLADEPTREPALLVGALVVLALQTEVKLTRTDRGKWALTVHKHAAKDSTLGHGISELLASYWPGNLTADPQCDRAGRAAAWRTGTPRAATYVTYRLQGRHVRLRP